MDKSRVIGALTDIISLTTTQEHICFIDAIYGRRSVIFLLGTDMGARFEQYRTACDVSMTFQDCLTHFAPNTRSLSAAGTKVIFLGSQRPYQGETLLGLRQGRRRTDFD